MSDLELLRQLESKLRRHHRKMERYQFPFDEDIEIENQLLQEIAAITVALDK